MNGTWRVAVEDFYSIRESSKRTIRVTEPRSKGEEGVCKEEVPGSIPCGRGGKRCPLICGSHWEALSLMHVAERQAQIFLFAHIATGLVPT
eukprot:266842-Pelagomonas_calceolata.AAC.1